MYFNFDKRGLYITLVILLLLTLMNLGSFNLVSTLLTLPGVIMAISFHEFAHAFAADRLGDSTSRKIEFRSLKTYRSSRYIFINICTYRLGKTSTNKHK